VTSLSGQTIEVSTPMPRAGSSPMRSVCQGQFKPQAIVDLATLTGAVISAGRRT
jgi:hypothetical protein